MKNLLKTAGLLLAMNTMTAEAQTVSDGYPQDNTNPKAVLPFVNKTIAPASFDENVVEVTQKRDWFDKTVAFTLTNPATPGDTARFVYVDKNGNKTFEKSEFIRAEYKIVDSAGNYQTFTFRDHERTNLVESIGKNYGVTRGTRNPEDKKVEEISEGKRKPEYGGGFSRYYSNADSSAMTGVSIELKKSVTEEAAGHTLFNYNTGIITRVINGTGNSTMTDFSVYSADFTTSPQFLMPMVVVSNKLEGK